MAWATTIELRTDLRLMRLMQLVSPTLPVGAFAYSQGLEWAVEAGWVCNARQTQEWIHGVLLHGQACLDIPVMARLYGAWQDQNMAAFGYWNRYLAAARGSSELQREDRHMGQALHRLLRKLAPDSVQKLPDCTPSFTAMFAAAACNWSIDLETTCAGFLWSWAENQVSAAIKLVPLGQTQGQIMMMKIAEEIPGVVRRGLALSPDDIGAITPSLTMASMLHETQHTRLFRS